MIRESHFERLVMKNMLEEQQKKRQNYDENSFSNKPRKNKLINDYNQSDNIIYQPDNTFPKINKYESSNSKQKPNHTLKGEINHEVKQYNSSRRDILSSSKRKKSQKSTSIQSIKRSKEKRFIQSKNKMKIRSSPNSDEAEIKTSMMLRVKEEMSIEHAQTYNYLKKWFGKIFINKSNSQDKFFETFQKYLQTPENLYFLCFGESKSGKTFSIQGTPMIHY